MDSTAAEARRVATDPLPESGACSSTESAMAVRRLPAARPPGSKTPSKRSPAEVEGPPFEHAPGRSPAGACRAGRLRGPRLRLRLADRYRDDRRLVCGGSGASAMPTGGVPDPGRRAGRGARPGGRVSRGRGGGRRREPAAERVPRGRERPAGPTRVRPARSQLPASVRKPPRRLTCAGTERARRPSGLDNARGNGRGWAGQPVDGALIPAGGTG